MQRISSKKKSASKRSLTRTSSKTTSGSFPSSSSRLVKYSMAPTTFGARIGSINQFPAFRNIVDVHGTPGLSLSGTCNFGYAWQQGTTPATPWRLISSSANGTNVAAASLQVHPRSLFPTGSLAWELAYLFDYYQFKKIRIFYVPTASSASEGGFTIVYRARYGPVKDTSTGEGNDLASSLTFPSCSFGSYWEPRDFEVKDLSHRENYFACLTSSVTEVQERYQGEIFIAGGPTPYITVNDAVKRGMLFMEYDLELFGYSPNNTYTVTSEGPSRPLSVSDEKRVDDEPVLPGTKVVSPSIDPASAGFTVVSLPMRRK